MAKLVHGMNQSLDGYVHHLEFRSNPALFRHFTEQVRELTGCVYGREARLKALHALGPLGFEPGERESINACLDELHRLSKEALQALADGQP